MASQGLIWEFRVGSAWLRQQCNIINAGLNHGGLAIPPTASPYVVAEDEAAESHKQDPDPHVPMRHNWKARVESWTANGCNEQGSLLAAAVGIAQGIAVSLLAPPTKVTRSTLATPPLLYTLLGVYNNIEWPDIPSEWLHRRSRFNNR